MQTDSNARFVVVTVSRSALIMFYITCKSIVVMKIFIVLLAMSSSLWWNSMCSEGAIPQRVIAENVGSTSVRVYWQAVKYADRYTVTFTQAQGMDQEGLCPSVSVNTTTAIIDIGQDVEPSDATMLRAFTTYFITEVAESDVLGTSVESDPITFTTQQTSSYICTTFSWLYALLPMIYNRFCRGSWHSLGKS